MFILQFSLHSMFKKIGIMWNISHNDKSKNPWHVLLLDSYALLLQLLLALLLHLLLALLLHLLLDTVAVLLMPNYHLTPDGDPGARPVLTLAIVTAVNGHPGMK